MNQVKKILPLIFNIKVWGYGLFWSWNVIFLAFMFLGFAPNMLPEMIDSIRNDLIPIRFLVSTVLVTLIPLIAVVLGLTFLRRSPDKLLILGYCVEGPLMVLLLARIFLVRDATPAVDVLYLVSLLGMFTVLWQLMDIRINERSLIFDIFRIIGLTLVFLVGIYAAVLMAFYVVPLLKEVPRFFWDAAREFWRILTHLEWESLVMVPFTLLGIILGLYTATLIVVAPIAVPLLYIKNWWNGLKAVTINRGRLLPFILTTTAGIASVLIFILANQQPQHKAYALLNEQPQTVEAAKSLLHQGDSIRKGLVNAFLAPVRYISAVGEVGHIKELYKMSFNLSDKAAYKVERVFEVAARPMLYEPMSPPTPGDNNSDWWNQRALRSEPQEATQLYEAFFDEPIIEGEREIIVDAVRNTWSGDQALLAWQSVDDREILLTHQEINITEYGDWAEVELYEAYQNQTNQRQEVVYYFSLPETAVLTGVWLGDTPDRENRSAFRVAPRGAAQQLYREQVRVNIDPALLEQIGPLQYRLRIFPIEQQRWHWDSTVNKSIVTPGPQMYMWMTYSVLADNGHWPLPQLAEKANVYWDQSTVRDMNGVQLSGETETWLPEPLAALNPVQPSAHQVVFPTGETVFVLPESEFDLPEPVSDLMLAVVLDRSLSMEKQRSEVAETLSHLETISSDVDVYLTTSYYRGEQASVAKLADLVPNNIIYFGGQNAADLLSQFFALSKRRSYDALFVLTDGSGFKLGGEEISYPVPDAPVWMVHMDGEYPLGYDDATLQAVQASGGGVAGSLEDALTRLAISIDAANQPEGVMQDIVDGYAWITIPPDSSAQIDSKTTTHTINDPFTALAARRLILSEMYRHRGQIDEIGTLDALHAIAVEQGIVTPYSSMIVLINYAQERRLSELEDQGNRFDREAEDFGETSPAPFEVTGVPEPHEWLLIGLSVVILGWYAWRRRMDPQRRDIHIL